MLIIGREMAARTCMLCGKALSRIWAGNGEDFCSREHRNQYRLRRGMDRLLEANKVANVMRRRESPRQIPNGLLRCPGPSVQHAFLDPLSPRDSRLAGFAVPAVQPAPQSRMPASSDLRAPGAHPGLRRAGGLADTSLLPFPTPP